MKKFFTIALLCGLMSGQAMGFGLIEIYGVGVIALTNEMLRADDEEFFIGEKKVYVCGDSADALYRFGDTDVVQTLGDSVHNGKNQGYNKSYKCSHPTFLRKLNPVNDFWTVQDTRWCNDTEFRTIDINNARYCIYVQGVEQACTPLMGDGVAFKNGCIKAECLTGYTYSEGKCVEKQKAGSGDGSGSRSCDGKPHGTVVSMGRAECIAAYKDWNITGDDVQNLSSCTKTCDDGTWIFESICKPGYTHPTSTVKCLVKKETSSVVVGKCHPSVCVSEVCRECCKRPASETVWDRTAQVCQCVNGGKFQKENGAWICKVDAGAVVSEQGYVCDPVLLANLAKWRTQCVNKSDVLRQILELEEYCKGKPSKEVFLRLYDETFNSVKQCAETAETVVDDTAQKLKRSRAKITSAYNDLVGIAKGFKVSVWKNKEGNFNTARLASDSIAAVVLGTTGALVTSSIVKKNQVEGGFEDIKCTIGGQTVADWGDEFRVGIQ